MNNLFVSATFSWHKFGDDFRRPIHIVEILIFAMVVRGVLHHTLKKYVKHMMGGKRGASEELIIRQEQRAKTVASLLSSIGGFIVWSIAFIMVLSEIGLNLAPLIAGAGIAGAALGFGAQQLVRDILAGMSMLAEDQFGIGDVVDVVDVTGVVDDVGLRTTRIRAEDGTLWFVPNGEIKRLGNKSAART